jgi:hypothetical protein
VDIMTQHRPTNEELMAFADGALAPAEAQRIAGLVNANPELRSAVEMFRQSSELVREARGALDGDPVPDTLRRSVEAMIAQSEAKPEPTSNVVDFIRKNPAAAPWRPWAMPIAAALAAVIGGIAGYEMATQGGGTGDTPILAAVGNMLPSDIAAALGKSPSGSELELASGKLRVIATVRKDGGLCREFEVDDTSGRTIVGIGCREEGAWRLDIAVAAPPTEVGYAPASSFNAIESYLGMIEASDPLTPAEEAEALS